MKFLTLLFFILSFSFANAQSFAPQGATWHYSKHFFGPSQYAEHFTKLEVNGDTIIGGVNCSKIQKINPLWCHYRPDEEFVYVSNDTVFFYDTTFSQFQILYDFNAVAGDSWEIRVPDFNFGEDTVLVEVDSTDFTTINTLTLKRLHVRYTYIKDGFSVVYWYSSILERIGDINYVFDFANYSNIICDGDWTSGLRCYKDSVIGLYETGIANSCEYIELSNSILENEINSFALSPNPADDYIQISMQNGYAELIQLIDFQGRLMLETKDESIDLSDFKSGVYLVRVLSDGRWSQRRLTKI